MNLGFVGHVSPTLSRRSSHESLIRNCSHESLLLEPFDPAHIASRGDAQSGNVWACPAAPEVIKLPVEEAVSQAHELHDIAPATVGYHAPLRAKALNLNAGLEGKVLAVHDAQGGRLASSRLARIRSGPGPTHQRITSISASPPTKPAHVRPAHVPRSSGQRAPSHPRPRDPLPVE